jgi:hypothetical protein
MRNYESMFAQTVGWLVCAFVNRRNASDALWMLRHSSLSFRVRGLAILSPGVVRIKPRSFFGTYDFSSDTMQCQCAAGHLAANSGHCSAQGCICIGANIWRICGKKRRRKNIFPFFRGICEMGLEIPRWNRHLNAASQIEIRRAAWSVSYIKSWCRYGQVNMTRISSQDKQSKGQAMSSQTVVQFSPYSATSVTSPQTFRTLQQSHSSNTVWDVEPSPPAKRLTDGEIAVNLKSSCHVAAQPRASCKPDDYFPHYLKCRSCLPTCNPDLFVDWVYEVRVRTLLAKVTLNVILRQVKITFPDLPPSPPPLPANTTILQITGSVDVWADTPPPVHPFSALREAVVNAMVRKQQDIENQRLAGYGNVLSLAKV